MSKILINEFYRGTDLTTGDEVIELLLLEDLTSEQLESFFVGDAPPSPSLKAEKFSAYEFTNTSSIADVFQAGTIIVVGGTAAITEDTSYDPTNGDWTIALNTDGAFLPNANPGNGGDITQNDILWVDIINTGDTISADGFAIDIGTQTTTFTNAVNVNFDNIDNGVALNSDATGASDTGNWTTRIPLNSTTFGEPNGEANTTFIESLRNNGNPDPNLPVITIEATDATAAETEAGTEPEPDTGTFTLTRTGDTTNELTVNFTLGGSATNVDDYQNTPSSVTFAANSSTATITITPVDDTIDDNDETVIVTLSDGQNYNLNTQDPTTATATITITDNDDPDPNLPVITIEATDATATETEAGTEPDTGTFTLRRTGDTTNELTVNFTLGGTIDEDYTTTTPTSVIFAAESETAIITITPVDDIDDDNETVVATLEPGENYTVGGANTATITITDNDQPSGGGGDSGGGNGDDSDEDQSLNGSSESDSLSGTNGNDTINAESGNDFVQGGNGDDFIEGGDGNDLVYGNENSDTVIGGLGDDFLHGGQNNDLIYGNENSDTVIGGLGDDFLHGGQNDDLIYGNENNDTVIGGLGDDFLHGGQNDDILIGNTGNDTLTGGLGSDRFRYQSSDEGVDIIADFISGEDLVEIVASGFNSDLNLGTLSNERLILGQIPTNNSDFRFRYDLTTGALFFDRDGTGANAEIQLATLNGIPNLSASDFVVI